MARRRADNTMARRRRTDNTISRRMIENAMARRRRTNNALTRRKRTNTGLQNTTQKTKDSEKNYHKLVVSGMASNSCFTSDYRRVTVKRHEHHLIRKSCWTPVCENKYK
jgi:hypothetical protein